MIRDVVVGFVVVVVVFVVVGWYDLDAVDCYDLDAVDCYDLVAWALCVVDLGGVGLY